MPTLDVLAATSGHLCAHSLLIHSCFACYRHAEVSFVWCLLFSTVVLCAGVIGPDLAAKSSWC